MCIRDSARDAEG